MAKSDIVFDLRRHIRSALETSGLAPGGSLVVAVSGGPDSMALLHALHYLRDSLHLRLHGAHLDHGLRGDASVADAEYVAESLRRLGIALTLQRSDVSLFRREHRLSMEQAAREVRYAFLARVAEQLGAGAIAVGHTADDQAETVLMHILRGSGLTGIRGMRPAARRTFDGREVLVFRPLLRVSRRETVEYCRHVGLEPRLDESNLSVEPRRNWVRLELLPLLRKHNPAVVDALLRLSRSATRDLAYLEDRTDAAWSETVRQDGGDIELDRAAFSRLDPAIQNHLLRRAVSTAKGGPRDIEQNHIDGIARLMSGSAGRSMDLPAGMRFSVGYVAGTLSASGGLPCPMPRLEGCRKLNVPGMTLLPGWRVNADLVGPAGSRRTAGLRGGPAGKAEGRHRAVLDREALGEGLWVRPRRPGDRFQPLGMSHAKKLQDFMVDSKIPRPWRDRVPLVMSDRGIAWVVGWRIADWAKVNGGSAENLELRFTRR